MYRIGYSPLSGGPKPTFNRSTVHLKPNQYKSNSTCNHPNNPARLFSSISHGKATNRQYSFLEKSISLNNHITPRYYSTDKKDESSDENNGKQQNNEDKKTDEQPTNSNDDNNNNNKETQENNETLESNGTKNDEGEKQQENSEKVEKKQRVPSTPRRAWYYIALEPEIYPNEVAAEFKEDDDGNVIVFDKDDFDVPMHIGDLAKAWKKPDDSKECEKLIDQRYAGKNKLHKDTGSFFKEGLGEQTEVHPLFTRGWINLKKRIYYTVRNWFVPAAQRVDTRVYPIILAEAFQEFRRLKKFRYKEWRYVFFLIIELYLRFFHSLFHDENES